MLTQLELKSKLLYNEETGLFIWKAGGKGIPKNKKVAGSYEKNRYHQIGINGRLYYGHRLAWLYMFGKFPANEIDHVNGNKHDNRIVNLRDVSTFINGHNRHKANKNNLSTGMLGARLDTRDGRYYAGIMINRKNISLGGFKTASEAHSAYLTASMKINCLPRQIVIMPLGGILTVTEPAK